MNKQQLKDIMQYAVENCMMSTTLYEVVESMEYWFDYFKPYFIGKEVFHTKVVNGKIVTYTTPSQILPSIEDLYIEDDCEEYLDIIFRMENIDYFGNY